MSLRSTAEWIMGSRVLGERGELILQDVWSTPGMADNDAIILGESVYYIAQVRNLTLTGILALLRRPMSFDALVCVRRHDSISLRSAFVAGAFEDLELALTGLSAFDGEGLLFWKG